MAVGFFAPNETIKIIGYSIAGGVFGVDYLMDWIAGFPTTRRILSNFMVRIRRTAFEEEQKEQQRRRDLVSLAAKAQTGLTSI